MYKLLPLAALLFLGIFSAKAQTVSDFESFTLAPESYFMDNSKPNEDNGFQDGMAYFPYVFDTSWGGLWISGFAYSNVSDTITSGFSNQYSAKTGIGQNASNNYAVAYNQTNYILLKDSAVNFGAKGFYITNNTYAFNSMRDGDAFAKQFGGASGNDPDFLLVTIKGYHQNVWTGDSVDVYLADYRDANNANDFILNTWEWVNLTKLGVADSIAFVMSSSDNGSFGMNTPAYFAIDDFTTADSVSLSVTEVQPASIEVYPVPFSNELILHLPADPNFNSIQIVDVLGKEMVHIKVHSNRYKIETSGWPAGVYFVRTNAHSSLQKTIVKHEN